MTTYKLRVMTTADRIVFEYDNLKDAVHGMNGLSDYYIKANDHGKIELLVEGYVAGDVTF